jgi:hypothetical protein
MERRRPVVRRSVRAFAALGLAFGASIQLGWTPATPYQPALTLLTAIDGTVPVARILYGVSLHFLRFSQAVGEGFHRVDMPKCSSLYQPCDDGW